jgi:hypothetical protein
MVKARSLYANHNVYVTKEESEEVTAFQTFTKNNIWKLTKQLRIFDSKSKNNYFLKFEWLPFVNADTVPMNLIISLLSGFITALMGLLRQDYSI